MTVKLQIAEFDEIGPNKSVADFLSMKYNKTDGAFVLEFTRADGTKDNIDGGYYTNGEPLAKSVEFEIKSDTTLVTFSGTKY